jgi:hypothetical protein
MSIETAGDTPRLKKRNRRDHYVPQGYLRGFIDPLRVASQQPLWHFDVHQQVWSERSTREIGYRIGLYDYGSVNDTLESADDTFKSLENSFPLIRGELISTNFENWMEHRDFLLHYMQMIRARSILFFEQKYAEGKNLRALVVDKVNPDGRSATVRSLTPSELPDDFIKNWTITEMRTEIQQGAAWLRDFDWAIRYCSSVNEPFVSSESPFMVYGPGLNVEENVLHPDSLVFFPLCWQACLVGSRRAFDVKRDVFLQEDMRTFRRMYRKSARLFVVSPRQLSDL